jgi:hypothetical protein
MLCIRLMLYFYYAELPKAGMLKHVLGAHVRVHSWLTIKVCVYVCVRLKINRVSKTSFDVTLKEGNFQKDPWTTEHTRRET